MIKTQIVNLVCLLWFFQININGEPVCHFVHYSTENGLPQYTIMDMLQDKNGFMWFGTWDGLSKFDGYRFQNFKVRPEDSFYMKSNRIEKLYEDKFGKIWFRTYDKEIHCFDANKSIFQSIQILKNNTKQEFRASKIEIKPSGKVWLLSPDNGCVVVKDSLLNTDYYSSYTPNISATAVFSVLEDNEQNSWLLTNNGINLLTANNNKIKSFLTENTNINSQEWQSFFSGIDMGKQLYFGSQNGRLWKYSKLTGKFQLMQLSTNGSLNKLIKIDNGKFIIIVDNGGFIVYNVKQKTFKEFNSLPNSHISFKEISETFLIRSQQFWFTSKEPGIFRFDIENEKIKHFKSKQTDSSPINFPPDGLVYVDVKGRTWVHPKGGGFGLLNKATDTIDPFYNDRKSANSRFSNVIHSAYSDFQGNLWLCTRSKGLEKIVFDKNFFHKDEIAHNKNDELANDVRMVYEDPEKNIWISTKDGKLTIFDKNKKKIGCLSANGSIVTDAVLPATVYCCMIDNERNIWLGTRGAGIYRLTKKTNKKYLVQHFTENNTDIYSLSDNSVYSILQDKKGHIWIGTYGGGLNLMQRRSDGSVVFINHKNELRNFPINTGYRIRCLAENGQGNICVGTTSGMLMFSSNFNSCDEINFNSYMRKPNKPNSLSNNDIHGIIITRKSEMFLATYGGGLNKVSETSKNGFPLSFKYYSVRDGLPSDVLLSIVEDQFGMLWIGSENNITRFDPSKGQFKTFAEIKRLINSDNFSEASSYRLHSNELIFGYSGGTISFFPTNKDSSVFIPKIVFSGFQLFNKNIEPDLPESPLMGNINSIKKLILKHDQNFISIEYAALDYVDPDNIQYAYKLDGFDQDWNYVQKQRIANYTNLPKGKYTFKVKSTNSEGIWIDNERTLIIEVQPSFWESYWAYLIYIVLIISSIYTTLRVLLTFYKLRGNIEMEKKMSDIKMRFFTDISHEIRTPLTMITAPVENILLDDETPVKIKKQLKTVSQNTNRILRLVNQILDFRKIQYLHLKIQEVEPDSLIEEIADTFSEIASKQHIQFDFINKAEGIKLWVDKDSFEKMLVNLLSNAFKYTAPWKSITITLSYDDKYVHMDVQDNGKGMSKEKQKNLFVRFASFNDDKSKPSTGIGLSLVKELADKHSAKITVQSDEGIGSKFTISFLRGVAHFDNKVEVIGHENNAGSHKVREPENFGNKDKTITEQSKNSIKNSVLIVEDDNELREFIRTAIEPDYQVLEAENGNKGLKLAVENIPDFVVSDVMMPEMDGIELLQRLKTDSRTSHIPVLLLSAKTDIDSKLEGLKFGADDYITKPFSVQYFKARIENLIAQRQKLQELFISKLSDNPFGQISDKHMIYNVQDDKLMTKIISLINENLENSEFQVDDLCKYVNMSRTVFYKKIKNLTGMAPVEFVRDIRLEKAAQLIKSGDIMIKEAAYSVGIYDIRYFSRCFKVKYGVTPLEYRKKYPPTPK